MSSSDPARISGIDPSLFTAGISDEDDARPGDLLDHDAGRQRVRPGAAVLLGHVGRGEVGGSERVVRRLRELGALVHLRACGATFASHTARTASRIAWCSSDSAYIGKSLMARILLPGKAAGSVRRMRLVTPG